MKSSVVLAGLLAAAGSAMAAPFNAVSYEAGGGLPGIVGAGFTVSSGGFFTHVGAGTNVAPGAAGGFTATNFQEFDSHFALDTVGPSVRNRSTGTTNNSNVTLNFYGRTPAQTSLTSPFYAVPGAGGAPGNSDYNEGSLIVGYSLIVGPGSHIGDFAGNGSNPENKARAGIGVAPPPVPSGFAPNPTGGRSNLDGVFIARLTVSAGATISGDIFFTTLVAPGVGDGKTLVLGGPAVSFNTHNGPQLLVLRAYKVNTADPVDITEPSAATAAGVNENEPFGLADVWDIWVHLIPTPGALALFGLGGLALIRRRRA